VNTVPFTKPNAEVNPDLLRAGEGEILDEPVKDSEMPLPLRALLTRPVIISVANYAMIGLINMAAAVLIPLVWSTSVELGGLSMSPASIELWMTGCGLMSSILQFIAFPRLVRCFGPRRVFIASILCFSPVYTMFPFENLASRHSGRDPNLETVFLIGLQLSALSFSDIGFGELFEALRCVRSLKLCDSIRRGMYVRILCCPQQAVTWRYERNRADDGFDPTHGRTSCRRVAICVLT
jgi:hypothetical protein